MDRGMVKARKGIAKVEANTPFAMPSGIGKTPIQRPWKRIHISTHSILQEDQAKYRRDCQRVVRIPIASPVANPKEPKETMVKRGT
mmetsp:Transcript_86570/g.190054  ORF Transcript_86570/g.190054 Transcript_86570/m.190054 type:complete len:86 (+) Transcript_86570:963-1220(+)